MPGLCILAIGNAERDILGAGWLAELFPDGWNFVNTLTDRQYTAGFGEVKSKQAPAYSLYTRIRHKNSGPSRCTRLEGGRATGNGIVTGV